MNKNVTAPETDAIAQSIVEILAGCSDRRFQGLNQNRVANGLRLLALPLDKMEEESRKIRADFDSKFGAEFIHNLTLHRRLMTIANAKNQAAVVEALNRYVTPGFEYYSLFKAAAVDRLSQLLTTAAKTEDECGGGNDGFEDDPVMRRTPGTDWRKRLKDVGTIISQRYEEEHAITRSPKGFVIKEPGIPSS